MSMELLTAVLFTIVLLWAVVLIVAVVDSASRSQRNEEKLNYLIQKIEKVFDSTPGKWARDLADYFHKKGNDEGKMLAEAIIKKLSGKKRGRKPKNEQTQLGPIQPPVESDSVEG